jgi:hypothetical protein
MGFNYSPAQRNPMNRPAKSTDVHKTRETIARGAAAAWQEEDRLRRIFACPYREEEQAGDSGAGKGGKRNAP